MNDWKQFKKNVKLVEHYKNNVLASDNLKSVEEEMSLPLLKVKPETATRWNSSYIMLERHQKAIMYCWNQFIHFSSVFGYRWMENNWRLCRSLKACKWTHHCFMWRKTFDDVSGCSTNSRIWVCNEKYYNCTEIGEELRRQILDTLTRRLDNFETNEITA